MSAELAQYLEEQRKMRGWSQRELARQAGITHDSVRRAFNPDPVSPASYDVLAKIAAALRIHPETLFIKAGLFPRKPEQSQLSRHLDTIFPQLPTEHQRMLVMFADYLFTMRTQLFPLLREIEAESPDPEASPYES